MGGLGGLRQIAPRHRPVGVDASTGGGQKMAATLSCLGRVGDAVATLTGFGRTVDARVGKAGLLSPSSDPAEGDMATPQGSFGLRTVYFRPDREARPRTGLPVRAIRPFDLWCDDPQHALYNRPVTAPFAANHERLWRQDRAYDLVVVMDFNLTQPIPGRGSAIFFHLTKTDDDPQPTAGCVAVAPDAMRWLLSRLSIGDRIVIGEA